MSILDTFFLMFEGDASGAKKASEEAEKASEKTAHEVVKHGEAIKHSNQEVEVENSKLAESFDVVREHAHSMTERLIEHAFEVAAAFQALFAFEKGLENFFEQAEISENLGHTASMLGVNIEQLDAWGHVVTLAGGTAQGFQGSLENLNFQLERIAVTGHSRALPFFEKLGITVKDASGHVKNAFELLPQLAEKIEGMPKPESASILRALGLDKSTIFVLQQGKKELDELLERQKLLGLTTQKDAEIAEKFNDEWLDIKQLFTSLVIEADTGLMPLLYDLLKIVEDIFLFLKEHKDLAIGVLIGIAGAALIAGEAFGVLGAIMGFVFSPVVLITSAVLGLIAVFGFLYDDIVNFAEGNNSIIGELAKRWPIVGEAVKLLIDVFETLWEIISTGAKETIAWISKIPEGFEQWKELVASAIEWIKAEFDSLPEPIKAIFEDIGKLFKAAFGALPEEAKLAFDIITTTAEGMYEALKNVFKLIADLIVNPKQAFQNFVENSIASWDKLVAKIPNLATEFDHVVAAIKGAAADAAKVFTDLWDRIGWIINKLASVGSAVGGWISKQAAATPEPFDTLTGRQQQGSDGAKPAPAHPFTGNPDDVDAIVKARAALAETQSPLMAQTSASLATDASKTVTNNINASVGTVTINTQATDAAGIQKAMDDHLEEHYKGVLSNYANGVSH